MRNHAAHAVPLQPALEELKRQAAARRSGRTTTILPCACCRWIGMRIFPRSGPGCSPAGSYGFCKAPDCAVFHRLQARRRESGGGAETAAPESAAPHPDVRCAVAQRAETHRDAGGQLQRSRPAEVREGDAEFSGAECRFVLETLGEVYGYDAAGAGAGPVSGAAPALPPGAQRAGDGETARLARRPSSTKGR